MSRQDIPVRPGRGVEVEVDGAWQPAILDWWQQRDDGSWRGHVIRYIPGGRARVEWYPAERIRPLEDELSDPAGRSPDS